ncbi:hypothetical protein JD844_024307 [Phrynosoma platyrhinos]|uniref:Armadillo repeat-containing protein 2 n=1 Tax=Phrynosoma platyrhinos TaxID=52577 RepID=A0ABQ7SY33_PHRPL|nr:hypothetical protein JD844_024307 [Phrynosoma platyrhinos]
MQSSRSKKEYSEAFYKPPLAVQKTSAEIINEARNTLRTLRTQRPFTPREQQRKLFGSASSRTPDNRPPSAFSLCASSFESVESRPVSCARLSPLDHKPKLLLSATSEEENPVSPAKPPVDSEEIRKVSNARALLFKTAACGNLLPDKVFLPIESKRQNFEEQAAMGDISKNSNENFPEKPTVQLNFKDKCVPLTYKEHHSKIVGESVCPKMTAVSPSSQLSSQSDPINRQEENNLEADETEEEENYWNMKILPILHELETAVHILKVSGKNLLNVCKLVFKISRNEKNDSLIQNDRILDSLLEILGTEDLGTNTEAFLYCMGAIKFISGNTRLIHEMVNKGSVEILVQLLKQINDITENDARFSSSGHLLVQLTATLRNLVDLPESRCKLLEYGAIPELCLVLEKHMSDQDVCINVARIFSKLSSFNDCCTALADCSRCYILFLALLNKHTKKQDLVVRIIFILGNLTAKNNQAREQFFEMQGSIDTLIALFQYHCEADANGKLWNDGGELKKLKHPSKAEDVLIKLIRVIANLSIHPCVGASLATNHQIVALLIKVLEYKSVEECEELVINTTATINNLSFYQVKDSVIQERKLYIAELLLKLLMSSNMDGILEAIRVFGNLSQYHEICDFIIQRKVYKFMIALLDAKHQEVCFSACGVLLNLTVDKSRRSILNEEGGIKKLIDCLRDFGPTDWQLACLICKTLWNYSESITSAQPCFEDDDTNTLLVLLTSFLDEELALDYSFDSDLRDYHILYWETEFKPVAQKLLQKIQN